MITPEQLATIKKAIADAPSDLDLSDYSVEDDNRSVYENCIADVPKGTCGCFYECQDIEQALTNYLHALPPTTAQQFLDRIDHLEQENFTLSAGACVHAGGDDHGHPLCLLVDHPGPAQPPPTTRASDDLDVLESALDRATVIHANADSSFVQHIANCDPRKIKQLIARLRNLEAANKQRLADYGEGTWFEVAQECNQLRKALKASQEALQVCVDSENVLRAANDFLTQCSFCQKGPPEANLIIGPNVSVCFPCVDNALDNMGDIRINNRDD